jgi:hypothetical protein
MYEYSWSELLLKPTEFDFGPSKDHSESDEEAPLVAYVSSERFHAPPIKPPVNSMFSNMDFSAYMIQFAISSAIFVKQTSIPDRLSQVTETAVEFTSIMEQHYAIKEKVKSAGYVFVNVFVGLVTTLVAAILQAMIAYHNTPGINQPKKIMVEIDSRVNSTIHDNALLVTFCVGGLTYTTQLEHLVSRKRSLLGRLVFNRKHINSTIFIDRDGQHFRHILNHLRGTI